MERVGFIEKRVEVVKPKQDRLSWVEPYYAIITEKLTRMRYDVGKIRYEGK